MQCSIKPVNGPINARINIPGSKKITNRALILAALADGVSEITHINFSENTKTFIQALQQAGIAIQTDEASHSCLITGCNGNLPKKQATIWCGDMETAMRYLLAACAASAGTFYFDGAAQLHKADLSQQLNLLCRQGAQSIPRDNHQLPLALLGADSFEGGEMIFEKDTQTPVLTAFLLLSPYARTPFSFTILEPNKQNHIDMTCSMMAEFGVLVRRIHRGQFMVPVPQRYHARDYRIEPDPVLLAFFFAAATVTGGDVSVQPFKRSRSKQADIKSLAVFEKLGCQVRETAETLDIAGPDKITGLAIAIRKFSASFAALLCVAPFAESPIVISHSKIFRAQKKHWLQTVKNEFDKLGIRMDINENNVTVYPGAVKGAAVDCHQDPLIALMFAVIGLRVPGVIINNVDCVNRLYPGFFDLWDKLREPPMPGKLAAEG